MRGVLWTILFVAMIIACAVPAPPPGGPEDKTPPSILATFPAAGSSGVDPGSEIGFSFSEGMKRSRLERLVQLSPQIEIGTVRWKGNTIFIRPAEPLHPDTTYLVTLGPGFRDEHNVADKNGHQFAFATSAAIDSGAIAGRVYFRREPTKNGLVRCFVLPVDSGFRAEGARPDRESTTDKEGYYRVEYLATEGQSYILWAFEDANANATFAPGSEAGLTELDTVILTPGTPFVDGRDLYIVDPNEPAKLAGVVFNRSGLDTFAVSVALHTDSTGGAPSYLVACDTAGVYEFANVRAGKYLLYAIVDIVADSVCGWYPCFDDSAWSCEEPCAQYPDTLFVEPGGESLLDTLTLFPATGRKEQ